MLAAVGITVYSYIRHAPYGLFSLAPKHICGFRCPLFRVVISLLSKAFECSGCLQRLYVCAVCMNNIHNGSRYNAIN
jgi:hypothetical protein